MNPHCIQSKRIESLLCDIILAESILKAQVESDHSNHDLTDIKESQSSSLVLSVDQVKAGVLLYGVACLAHTPRLRCRDLDMDGMGCGIKYKVIVWKKGLISRSMCTVYSIQYTVHIVRFRYRCVG